MDTAFGHQEGIYYYHAKLTLSKENSTAVSVFVYNISKNPSALPLAQNALKKLKTMRHPSVVKYLDSLEVKIKNKKILILHSSRMIVLFIS